MKPEPQEHRKREEQRNCTAHDNDDAHDKIHECAKEQCSRGRLHGSR